MFPKAERILEGDPQSSEPITLDDLACRARTWWTDEPDLLRRERKAMAAVAPDLVWLDTGAGSWEGLAPTWPFDRAVPAGLDALLAGRRFHVQVAYGHAFPITAPVVWPIDPEPSIEHRTQHAWHVNGDGSLCLLEAAAAWTGRETAAELIIKAAGWFIEYVLMTAGLITDMTSVGLAADLSLDAIIAQVGVGQPACGDVAPDGDNQGDPAGHLPEMRGNAGGTS